MKDSWRGRGKHQRECLQTKKSLTPVNNWTCVTSLCVFLFARLKLFTENSTKRFYCWYFSSLEMELGLLSYFLQLAAGGGVSSAGPSSLSVLYRTVNLVLV